MYRTVPLLFAFILSGLNVMAQFSDIRGEVKFPNQSDALYAYVSLIQGNTRVASRYLNDKGEFVFDNLTSGQFKLIVKCQGYHDYENSFYLDRNESKYMVVNMVESSTAVDTLVVRYNTGLDVGGGGGPPFTGDEIILGPKTSVIQVASQDMGTTVRGGQLQGDGTRVGQLSQVRNGMTRIGPSSPTLLDVESVKVITAGVPAMYGDFVGGAIEYNTRQSLDSLPQRSLLLRSSSPFNAYHQNALETYFYRPFKVEDGNPRMSLATSFYTDFNRDPNPSFVQLYRLDEHEKEALLNDPMITAPNGSELPASNRFTLDQFEEVKARRDAWSGTLYGGMMFNWKPNNDLTFRIEPTFHYNRRRVASWSNSLLNSEHNPLNISRTANLNFQVVHQLKSPYNSKGELIYDSSLISKVNYLLIADYQRLNSETMDPIYKDDIFRYGHIGSFQTSGVDRYEWVNDELDVVDQNGKRVQQDGYYRWAGFQDTAVTFTASQSAPFRSAITSAVMNENHISTLSQLTQSQGLLNGQNPTAVHGMFYAPGTVVSNYSKSDIQKISVQAIVDLALNPTRNLSKRHDIQIGALFEQRRRSYYSLNANGLWQLMPQLLNKQFIQPDLSNPILTYDENGMFTDTVNYNWLVDGSNQTNFDQQLRALVDEQNGHRSRNAHFIDVNSIDPDMLHLDMFTASELWNNGSSMVGYAGYDAYGNLDRSQRQINEFLLNEDQRYIGAYAPNYTAIWIQDKVVLRDVKLRAGVRVERFDANQQVLRDPFSFYPVKTVAEVNDMGGVAVSHPSNLNEDARVYVDDINNPSKIVGYRSGSTWYNEHGVEVQSAEYLRIRTNNGVIQPYLVDPNASLSAESFTDYDPEILVLPRLSFSFPINTSALFYAYYDKFAQRPSFGQNFAPISSYYYLENASNTLLPNPSLKPAQRTNFQVGFKQALGRRSLLDVLAGYSEIRGDINLISMEQAYPRSYITYGNVDFSTVKSLRTEYQLKLPAVNLRLGYVLQFADGTGSNANSAAALIQANQPNLRSLYPLEYDIRHKWNANAIFNLDTLFAIKKKSWAQHMMFSIFGNAQSGSPYTAKLLAVPEAQSLGTVSRSPIKGNPFGSRMPWTYTLDLSLSKSMMVHDRILTLQVSALNVLNLQNIFGVYAYSSSPNDDGYLSSPQGLQQINNELYAQSFISYYNLKQNNPGNFGQPRMVNVTCRLSF